MKGQFIVLIFNFFDHNINKESLWELLFLSLSLSPHTHSAQCVASFRWGFPCSLLHCCYCQLSLGPLFISTFLGIGVSKTQFLLITTQRTAVLIRPAVDLSPWLLSHRRCLILDKLCYSQTHDKYRPLFINRMENKKTKTVLQYDATLMLLLKNAQVEA